MTIKLFSVACCLVILSACNNLKENDVKNMVGQKTNPVVDPVAVANQNPTFENLTAAGLAMSEAKKTDIAIQYFEKALALSPKNAVALNNLCAENNNLGHFEKAISFCQQALVIFPDFQLAKNNLKFAEDKKTAQVKLMAELKTKADGSKGKARASNLIDLGFEHYKMGNYDEAIAIWKKVPKSNEALYVRTLNNLGSAYIMTKKYDLAKSSLDEAANLDPKNQLVKNNQAWLKTESAAVAK